MTLAKAKFYLLIYLVLILTSCTMTSTKSKNPVFTDQAKTEKELTSLVSSENMAVNGKEITTDKKVTSELDVNITNGKNIPTNSDERKALGKSIAASIKRNLKDLNEFDTYTVLFITTVENSGVTTRNWKGNVFKSAEL